MTDNQQAVVVLPTYNERENITPIMAALFALPVQLAVVVVDDGSPDGTAALVRSLQPQYPRLHLLARTRKDGLASAYIAGFRYAWQHLRPGCLLQMDADFSHPIERIPDLLAAARRCDCVIGSRYVAGGRIGNWDLKRRLVSRFGNWYARTLLGVSIRDLTSGFKCFAPGVLQRIDLRTLQSVGYGFQIEVTYRLLQAGATVRELPITFMERRIGRSKFRAGIMWESAVQVLRMRQHRRRTERS